MGRRALRKNDDGLDLSRILADAEQFPDGLSMDGLFPSPGPLEIEVGNAALLYELDSFHKPGLLEAMKQQPGLSISGLKFRLKGSLLQPPAEE